MADLTILSATAGFLSHIMQDNKIRKNTTIQCLTILSASVGFLNLSYLTLHILQDNKIRKYDAID